MEESRRAYFARRLHDQEEELRAQLGWLEGGLGQSQQDSLQELSSYDNHPADLGSEIFERSKDLALRENIRRRLAATREALARLDAGTYGYCERCGQPIGEERLEAMPETSLCAPCRRSLEQAAGHRRRPVEEEVMVPPFGGLPARGARPGEEAAYDGEDAWQDAARHGTSETISDLPGSRRYPQVYADYDEDRAAVEAVDAIPYYRDAADGMLYGDHAGPDDEGPPRRR